MMKPTSLTTLLAAAALAVLGCHTSPPVNSLAPSGLHSPWDSQPVTLTQVPYECGPIVPIAPNISITTRVDSNPSPTSEAVKSAAYPESSEALEDLTRRVVNAADNYRSSGSAAAAACVATLLTAAAEDHAMNGNMGSKQAWKDQNRALRGIAIAYLKVDHSGVIHPDQDQLILAWMTSIALQERRYYEQAHCGPNGCALFSHQGLEAAMASAAIGIAANDPALYKWAIAQYKTAITHVDSQGMLHYDMDRQYALKFNLESAAALVQIAELGTANGEHLYDFDGGRVHLLVHTVTRGLVDPTPYRSITKDKQTMPPQLETWEVSWASAYDQRFPDPVIDQLLQQVNFKGSDMWGGEPWTLDAQ